MASVQHRTYFPESKVAGLTSWRLFQPPWPSSCRIVSPLCVCFHHFWMTVEFGDVRLQLHTDITCKLLTHVGFRSFHGICLSFTLSSQQNNRPEVHLQSSRTPLADTLLHTDPLACLDLHDATYAPCRASSSSPVAAA